MPWRLARHCPRPATGRRDRASFIGWLAPAARRVISRRASNAGARRASMLEWSARSLLVTENLNPGSPACRGRNWRKRVGIALLAFVLAAAGAYSMRTMLTLNLARFALDRDSSMKLQEREDGIAILFATPPAPWISPLKNEMNEIWAPQQLRGVNYYTYAGPNSWFARFSERSNPRSPYYQAWVGGYVVKMPQTASPKDPETLIREVTALDQRSWLEATGDSHPLAEIGVVERAGEAVIDGQTWAMWHAIYRSHSDLSARPHTQLAQLLGMPPESSWPAGTTSFHNVTLEGYMASRVDADKHLAVVLYECLATPSSLTDVGAQSRQRAQDELLRLMESARLRTVSQ